MTDKMLFSLSIFLTGLGAGIALATFVAPHSRLSLRIGHEPEPGRTKSKTASVSH